MMVFVLPESLHVLCAILWKQGSGRVWTDSCTGNLTDFAGQWTHIAIVWHLYPNIQMYFNGVKHIMLQRYEFLDHPTNPTVIANPGKLFMGKNHVEVAYNRPLNGVYDEIRIYDEPLEEADIQAQYNSY